MPIKSLSTQCENSDLRRIGDKFESCEVLREKIKTTLREEAPVNILKGNSISF